MPSLDKKIIREYNATRSIFKRKYLCYAPFTNMYFNIHGDAAPCWASFIQPDSYPAHSIKEIWKGKKFNQMRRDIKHYRLENTCGACLTNLQNGNYISVLSKAYDLTAAHGKYPVMMELELDNTCNLECIMCKGQLSSSIRKNREKKPPFLSPYDDAFVEQLNEFIPHLKEMRMNGGEPFLSATCRKIWNNVARLNPSLKIVVATNGTQWNDKVQEILESGNFHINVSIDSLTKNIYESIRVNADFDKVMQNFERFHQYCKSKGTVICLLVNPMRENWHEMPDFVNFCNERNIPLWFNTIQQPAEHSIWALPTAKLENIYNTLSEIHIEPIQDKQESFHNVKVYNNLVHTQIYNWLQESKMPKPKIPSEHGLNEQDFYERMLILMKQRKFNDTQIKHEMEIIHSKIDGILRFLEANNIDVKEAHQSIKNIPVEILYDELINNPVEELIKKIKF
ncbi:MAG: radical SAM protein [Bacteroidales bacterium]|nr:radical SAM protein [Bacteroidales bacterium]